jgi:hypothetical protein
MLSDYNAVASWQAHTVQYLHEISIECIIVMGFECGLTINIQFVREEYRCRGASCLYTEKRLFSFIVFSSQLITLLEFFELSTKYFKQSSSLLFYITLGRGSPETISRHGYDLIFYHRDLTLLLRPIFYLPNAQSSPQPRRQCPFNAPYQRRRSKPGRKPKAKKLDKRKKPAPRDPSVRDPPVVAPPRSYHRS